MTFAFTAEPGKPLIPGVSQLTIGIHYNYSVYGHTLLISQEQPTGDDVLALDKGDAAFALLVRDNIVFMLTKLGDRPWNASHYNWWINPPFLRSDPLTDLTSIDKSIALHACLAAADTGLVAAARTFCLSPDLSRALLQAVANQVRLGVDPWHQLEVARELLEQSPDLSCLLKDVVCVQFRQPDGHEFVQAPDQGCRPNPRGHRCASATQ